MVPQVCNFVMGLWCKSVTMALPNPFEVSMRRTLSIVLFLSIFPFLASAQQALTGTITGTVTDASEAAVPNAQVTARNVDTGLERTAASGEFGIYTLPALPVGDYEVTAKKQGFADFKASGVR